MNGKFIVYGLSLIVSLFTIYDIRYTIYASEATPSGRVNDIGYSRIDPSSPFYFLKTVRENLEMKLAQTTRVKNLRQLEFATRRLREARTIIGKSEDLIPPTLERYTASLKNLTENHLKSEQQFADDLKNTLTIHLQVLQKMHDLASSPRAKIFIRSTMNRIIQRKDVEVAAKLPVCSFFLKESSLSALNQTEQLVLAARAQECFQSIKALP